MDKVWKSKEKAQMTNLQEGQLHAAQLEDGPLFGPMFVGMSWDPIAFTVPHVIAKE